MLRRIIGSGFMLAVHMLGAPPDVIPATAPATSRAATAGEIAGLTDALEKTARDLGRWAYTETRVIRDQKGKIKTEVVVRYDPSKPYPEQWTPLTINGKPPGRSDLAKYRKQGERAQRRAENPALDHRPSLGEVIDVPHARIVEAGNGHVVFELPLRRDRNDRFPPEKFQVLTRLNPERGTVENISLRLRESFRARLILKVKSGDASLDFETVEPKYPPTLTSIRGDASASVLFVSVGGEIDLKRTDLKHVRPYDDRFEVQIGPLKALDF